MAVLHPKTLWTVLLAAVLSLTTVAATTNGTACGTMIVRSIQNDGFVSPHRNCTEEDHALVQAAVYAAFHALDGTRKLRPEERKLHNCNTVCDNMARTTCIQNYYHCETWAYANCGSWCYRRRAQETEPSIVVLDEIFDNINNNDPVVVVGGDGHRQLTVGDISSCFTEQQCIEKKALLYTSVLSLLGNVATECANLLLAPATLQCLMVMA